MAKQQPDAVAGQESGKPAKPVKADGAQTLEKQPKSAKSESRQPKEPRGPNPVVRFIRYVEASRAELRKVSWPTVRETRKTTIAVLCFIGIMAIILGLIDLGLSSLIKTILS